MKTLITALSIAAAATAASGCAPLDMSIFVEEAKLLDADCPEQEIQLGRGVMDLGPYIAFNPANPRTPRYTASFRVRSALQPVTIESTDAILADESLNEFVASRIILTYAMA